MIVGDALRRHRISAVLTGGACAAFHTGGSYQSVDVDFVLSGSVTQKQLDAAMNSVGFVRRRDRYVNPAHEFFVEFPRGPLAIGGDTAILPRRTNRGPRTAWMLSPTDSCRDRLAAYFHWNDRQSLAVAVEIASRQPVSFVKIRRWSAAEGALEKYAEFLTAARKRSRGRQKTGR